MVNIPINPSDIAGARPYNNQFTAVSMAICKEPSEGAKFVPMQFTFANTACWYVDMTGGNVQGGSISQAACMYVDNTNSMHDVNILFPDSGYQVRIGQGDGQLIPIITAGPIPPKFYVILDSSGATSLSDMCNIFVMNKFIPEFLTANTESFTNAIAFGYGPLFNLVPTFTQSNNFNVALSNTLRSSVIINARQYYITSMVIDIEGTASPDTLYDVQLMDQGSGLNIYSRLFKLTSTYADKNLVTLGGMNLTSSGGPLVAQINSLSGLGADFFATFNLYGGILVP